MKHFLISVIIITMAISCDNNKSQDATAGRTTAELIGDEQRQQLTIDLASTLHESWRVNRLLPTGAYDPRVKTTIDTAWISTHQTDQVDIANTAFADLPGDWQEENMAAAIVAMNEVISAYEQGTEFNDAFVESASAQVHIEWLKRNSEWAEADQKLPYAQLSEEEKDKDRLQVLKAIEVFEGRG